MQPHMPLLDPVRRQCLERGKALGQADGAEDARHLPRALHAEDRHAQARHRMHPRGAADEPHGERHFQRSHEITGGILFETGERGVSPVAGRIGMGAGFDGAGIVAGCKHAGADAVHHALVVGCGAIGIGLGEMRGLDDPRDDIGPAQRLRTPYGPRARQTPVGEIGQDAQIDPPARPAGNVRGQRLGHGVDGIGAHRITGIDDDMADHHRPAAALDDAYVQIREAAAMAHQNRIAGIADLGDARPVFQDREPCPERIAHAHELDLGDHQRLRGGGGEAAVIVIEPRRIAHGGHDRGFLGGHRHQTVDPVDAQIGGDADRNRHGTHRILDHALGEIGGQGAGFGEPCDVVIAEPGKGGKSGAAFCHAHAVKSRNPGTAPRIGGTGPVWRLFHDILPCRLDGDLPTVMRRIAP